MADSSQHEMLVRRIVGYIFTNYSELYSLSVIDDLPKPIGAERPPKIQGYRPDVFAQDVPLTTAIIGEAKTLGDLETGHSKRQYASFLSSLSMQPNGIFLIAVPFIGVPAALRVLREIIRALDEPLSSVKVIVLDDFREYEV